jgi:hypothetical protein
MFPTDVLPVQVVAPDGQSLILDPGFKVEATQSRMCDLY